MKKSIISLLSVLLLCLLTILLRPRVLVAQNGANPSEELISEVAISRPAHRSSEVVSADARINLDPEEAISLKLPLAAAGGRVYLMAPNGGSINNQGGKFEAAVQNGKLGFDFKPGAARGRYTVEISRGQHTKILEFWVGAEPPPGRPGPSLTFTGAH